MRNRKNYQNDVENGAYGVKEVCALNAIVEFYVTDNISDDIMHSFLPGVVKDFLEKTLTVLILVKKMFDLETLNYRI